MMFWCSLGPGPLWWDFLASTMMGISAGSSLGVLRCWAGWAHCTAVTVAVAGTVVSWLT